VDGALVQAATRGDGIEGTDITDKMYARKDLVPLRIKDTGVLQITGEIVAPKGIPNSRNYAAGALNLKDLEEFNSRTIQFYAYSVYPYVYDTFDKDMNYLSELGFYNIFSEGLDKIYPCDGVVFRINSNAEFEALGHTAKHPNGAYAKKERQEAVETIIIDVEWNTSRLGKVTPVAILEPVMIGDALVSRATLNNPGFIEALGLCIGDTVGVIRSGEIIPCIVYKVDA
jgi:DNA ligase (NAD+)